MNLKTEIDEEQMRKMFYLITETCCGAKYSSGRGKRLFNEMFETENEKECATKWIRKCKNWTLSEGIPENLKLSSDDIGVLKRLEAYCLKL